MKDKFFKGVNRETVTLTGTYAVAFVSRTTIIASFERLAFFILLGRFPPHYTVLLQTEMSNSV